MKKRIISLITAAAMTVPMAAVNAGAMESPIGSKAGQYWEYLEKFSDYESIYYYVPYKYNPDHDGFVVLDCEGKEFEAILSLDTDRSEIDAIMSELAPDYYYQVLDHTWIDGVEYLWLLAKDRELSPDTENVARQVCGAFKERLNVKKFTYIGYAYEWEECLLTPGEGFPFRFWHTDATVDEVQAVIDEKGLDYEIEIMTDNVEERPDLFRINPTRIMDFDESTEQLMPFIEKYGLKGLDTAEAKNGLGRLPIYEMEIDMLNSVDGDANCDNSLTIADATAIMQAIGNPDKYGLSAQAKFNADIYNTGDGITGLDALKILRIEAGLE